MIIDMNYIGFFFKKYFSRDQSSPSPKDNKKLQFFITWLDIKYPPSFLDPTLIKSLIIMGAKKLYRLSIIKNPIVAEREGFEPSVPLTVHTLSKRAD